jgi:putative exporter of polyketide antibiotics
MNLLPPLQLLIGGALVVLIAYWFLQGDIALGLGFIPLAVVNLAWGYYSYQKSQEKP